MIAAWVCAWAGLSGTTALLSAAALFSAGASLATAGLAAGGMAALVDTAKASAIAVINIDFFICFSGA